MGHLICIKECYNSMNKPFKIGSIYRYQDDSYIDMLGTKHYYLYEVNRIPSEIGTKFSVSLDKFGTGRMEFINTYFVTVSMWSRLTKEIDLEFDKDNIRYIVTIKSDCL